MNSFKTEIEWFNVADVLPEVPVGKYGIQVLVVIYDAVYEGMNPGKGCTVSQCRYGNTSNCKGFPSDVQHKENDFMEMYVQGVNGGDYGPISDEVVFWAYLPQAPAYPVVKKQSFIEKYGLEGRGTPVRIDPKLQEEIRILHMKSKAALAESAHWAKNTNLRYGGK